MSILKMHFYTLKKIVKKLEQKGLKLFIGYVFFAGIATIVDLGMLYVFTSIMGIHYFISAILSYTLGMITNFSLNKIYNFKNKSKQIGKQFSLFAVVALIGLVFNQIFIVFFVEIVGLWYLYSKIISAIIVKFWSFYGHKKLTFKLLK